MKSLITTEQRTQLLHNGQAHAEGQDINPLPVVKLFTPDAHAIWLLTELDPEDGDTAFACAIWAWACRNWATYGCPSWLRSVGR